MWLNLENIVAVAKLYVQRLQILCCLFNVLRSHNVMEEQNLT